MEAVEVNTLCQQSHWYLLTNQMWPGRVNWESRMIPRMLVQANQMMELPFTDMLLPPIRFSRVRLLVGLQPTRLLLPWDSPGKKTGVGCHFLLQCMKVESESEVTQSCLTLSDPMDCSPPGSAIHGIFWATVLEWGAIAFSLYMTWWTIFTI